MDIQLKRGLLEVSVLAAIKDQDSYGYQIIKNICPTRTVNYVRKNRIAMGHVQNIQYITTLTV